ncbi:hypothetical protein K431DRAFT_162245 [Polychaeton citri CBS 116435]|uniref:Uncharacterized protein n=1 Tax=Polychaeton citri CBS 116435 TaxID=1314669 RepID=A0A9P4UIP4_9PEZI|nr:hypothetical protein K431DRAFT_162245 [Polychaeton citri CBS 116435]
MCKLAKFHYTCQHTAGPQILLCHTALANGGQRCGNINGAVEDVYEPALCPGCVAGQQTQQPYQAFPQATGNQKYEESSSGKEDSDEDEDEDDDSNDDGEEGEEEGEDGDDEESEVSSFAETKAPANRRFADVNTPATILEESERGSGFREPPAVAPGAQGQGISPGGGYSAQGFTHLQVPGGVQAGFRGQPSQKQTQGFGASAAPEMRCTGLQPPQFPFQPHVQQQKQQQQHWHSQKLPSGQSRNPVFESAKGSSGVQTQGCPPGYAQAQPQTSVPLLAPSMPQMQGQSPSPFGINQTQSRYPVAQPAQSGSHAQAQHVPLATSDRCSIASRVSLRRVKKNLGLEAELTRLQLEASELEHEQADADLQRAIAVSLAEDEQRSLEEAISASMSDAFAWERRAEEEVRVAALRDYVDGLRRENEAKRREAGILGSRSTSGKGKGKATVGRQTSRYDGSSVVGSSTAATTLRPTSTATSGHEPAHRHAASTSSRHTTIRSTASEPLAKSERSPSPPISIGTASKQRSQEESRRQDRFNRMKDEIDS